MIKHHCHAVRDHHNGSIYGLVMRMLRPFRKNIYEERMCILKYIFHALTTRCSRGPFSCCDGYIAKQQVSKANNHTIPASLSYDQFIGTVSTAPCILQLTISFYGQGIAGRSYGNRFGLCTGAPLIDNNYEWGVCARSFNKLFWTSQITTFAFP